MGTEHTVLVVDDDPMFRTMLSDTLRAKGCAPITAAQGKTALERVRAEMPAVAPSATSTSSSSRKETATVCCRALATISSRLVATITPGLLCWMRPAGL